MPKIQEPCELLERTLTLLEEYREAGGSVTDLTVATGMSYHWFQSLHRTRDPGVNRIVCLYEHLSGKKLTLGD